MPADRPVGSPTCPRCGLKMERFALGYNIEAWRCLAKDKTFHAYDAPTMPAPDAKGERDEAETEVEWLLRQMETQDLRTLRGIAISFPRSTPSPRRERERAGVEAADLRFLLRDVREYLMTGDTNFFRKAGLCDRLGAALREYDRPASGQGGE